MSCTLYSQPVDHEDLGKPAPGDRVELDSEDEEDFTSPDEGSDSEPMLEDRDIRTAPGPRRKSKGLSANSAARQRNMRQKFVALLRRFKVTEPEEALKALKDSTAESSQGNDVDPEEIEDLLNELEDYSDYGPDLDTGSIGSTPKPSLRPFFSSSRSLIRDALDNPGGGKGGYSILEKPELGSDHLSDDSSKGAMSDSHPDTLTDPEHSDPPANTSSPPQSGDEVLTLAGVQVILIIFQRPGEKSSGKSREERGETWQQALHEGHDLLHQVPGQGVKPEQGGLVRVKTIILHLCSLSGKISPQQHRLATWSLNHSLFPSFG